jgi:hypothetical protein
MRLWKSSRLGKIRLGLGGILGTNLIPKPKYFNTEVGIFREDKL